MASLLYKSFILFAFTVLTVTANEVVMHHGIANALGLVGVLFAAGLTRVDAVCANLTRACSVGQYGCFGGCCNCSAGRYNISRGCSFTPLVESNGCNNCAAGQSTNGKNGSTCFNCSAGTYSLSGDPSCSNCTEPGYFCGAGSTSMNQTLCAAGNFGATAPQTNSNCSGLCNAGYYGLLTTVRTTANCDGLCSAGSWGVAGAKNKTCSGLCAAGYFGNQSGLIDFKCSGLCADGFYGLSTTNRTTSTCDGKCRAGYFGARNTPFASDTCSGPCKAGYSCDAGSTNATHRECPMGQWSGEGAANCTLCAAGSYSETELVSDRTSIAVCKECPPGTFSNNGSISCTPCFAGTWSSTFSTPYQCTPCIKGTYSNATNQTNVNTCRQCPPGRASAILGAISIKNCTQCLQNSFSPTSGASECQTCPFEGTSPIGSADCSCQKGQILQQPPDDDKYSNSLTCRLCPKGTVALQIGLVMEGTCDYCGAGHYCMFGIKHPCRPGTWTSASGNLSLSDAATCTQCPAGTFSASAGQLLDTCLTCSTGYYSGPAASRCTACEPGYYNPSVASTSKDACQPCVNGTYNGYKGQAVCNSQCRAGEYGTKAGGVSSENSCAFCKPGTFTGFAGLPSCARCASGSYTNTTGALSCVLCPKGSYVEEEGSISIDNCTTCKVGFTTAASGSSSPDACSVHYACPDFTQTQIPVPMTVADCVPLACENYTFLGNATGKGCTGCAAGYSGSRTASNNGRNGSCIICPLDGLCATGFLPIPLPKNASLLSGVTKLAPGSPFSFSSPKKDMKQLCVSAAATLSTPVLRTPSFFFSNLPEGDTLDNSPPGMKSSFSAFVIGAVGIAILIFIVIYMRLFFLNHHLHVAHDPNHPTHPVKESGVISLWLWTMSKQVLKSGDAFAFEHEPKHKQPQINYPTMLGGCCHMLGNITFLVLALLVVFRFQFDNSVTTSANDSIPLVDPITKWATPFRTKNFVPPFNVSTSLQVRVFSQLELGCATPLSWEGNDGSWSLGGSIADCHDGRTLLAFTCTACEFSASSSLTFKLPFSCQALFVEVISVDATGVLQSVALPDEDSIALDAALLSSITWSVSLQSSYFSDASQNKLNPVATTARGFRLLQGPSSAVRAVPDNNALKPLPSAVTVTIKLPIQLTYSTTIVVLRQVWYDLITTLIGLLGTMGLFRFLFIQTEILLKFKKWICWNYRCWRWKYCCCKVKPLQTDITTPPPPLPSPDIVEIGNPMFAQEIGNPIARGQWKRVLDTENTYCWFNDMTHTRAVADPPVGAITVDGWKRVCNPDDDNETWWEHITSQESVWEGPWVAREAGLTSVREAAVIAPYVNLSLRFQAQSNMNHSSPYDEEHHGTENWGNAASASIDYKLRYPRSAAEQNYDTFRELVAAEDVRAGRKAEIAAVELAARQAENTRRKAEIAAMELAAKQAGGAKQPGSEAAKQVSEEAAAATVVADQMHKETSRLQEAEKSLSNSDFLF